MIQRIQNLYLLIALGALAWFLLSSLPGASGSGWQMFAIYGMGLSAVSLVIISLLTYKDRDKQRIFVTITLADLVVFAALVYGSLFFSDNLYIQTEAGTDVRRLLGLLMPAIAYVSSRLALAGVKKDMKLVQSSDRLR